MTVIVRKPDIIEKLKILSADAQYDLACACGSTKDEHRRRSSEGKWIYPITLASGGRASLFKVLMSNVCSNDCKYCPLRENQDIRRCSLSPDEIVRLFLDYYNQGKVFGLFLSSGVIGTADSTMERIDAIARLLRNRHAFRGYIHLKIIPGASIPAINEAVSLASAVSLNIETPGAEYLSKVSSRKDYIRDIIEPIKHISRLTARGSRWHRVKQTTQFIVGAAGEPDRQIVRYMGGLYERLKLDRIYFSAYQQGLGSPDLPAEQAASREDILTREHRLYQVDFLMRKYGFKDSEILFDAHGQLSLTEDPKTTWAKMHPDFYPVDINHADKFELLRVPGLGPAAVNRILQQRRSGRICCIEDIGLAGKLLAKAKPYLAF
ncbi:MAG TPA: radical SAM protein [Anaerohalosphaeraceae bacterium]|nr:radical SAM protein [Anaerohalosphaeraceae bacterium]HOL31636.1 radical SAM protein [Anaerohalosphaeraceae bacterium]HOM75902.1 radical SAM protein [Anaerohalosphaeraceae bacterium]HPC63727.1 radical SAM protein [Anaerohalosphaeraceae bacterium]HPO69029.1 radical SAM protein [Anaerohalosphaeraceae bacterium]